MRLAHTLKKTTLTTNKVLFSRTVTANKADLEIILALLGAWVMSQNPSVKPREQNPKFISISDWIDVL